MSVSPSRRRLLQAALLAPMAAGCTSSPPRPARVDPDVALRAAAIARERTLLDQYAALATPVGATIRGEHEEHLRALGAPSKAPSAAASAGASTRPVATMVLRQQLASLERSTAAAHAADALAASPSLAVVLASLAASEASHQVPLA